MADWHVGQMVVCVDDTAALPPPGVRYGGTLGGLTKGCVYTIRGFAVHPATWEMGVYLQEIMRPRAGLDPYEPPFGLFRFRPVRKTSIDIFRALLTPSGDDGAATPSVPSRVPSLPDRVEQGSCHYPSLPPCRLPAGGPSLRPTAARLAVQLDGAPLSLHLKSSALLASSGSKQTTGATTDAGYLVHPSEILSEFGQGTSRGFYCR